MFGIAALPEHKPIVVLGGKDHHFHAGRFHGPAPLVGVECSQIKNCRVLQPIPPLLAGEGVGAEVDESDKFILQRIQLIHRGYYMRCLFDDGFPVLSLLNLDRASSDHGALRFGAAR
ncbi:hypothetical protein SDC9_147716 [bioreactor metagenome]|uniref:Uncharacterized protein n=1 Tax=bioreactor metagenome TaxID=1076179 RepID=A0A645EF54_9ZZZZ